MNGRNVAYPKISSELRFSLQNPRNIKQQIITTLRSMLRRSFFLFAYMVSCVTCSRHDDICRSSYYAYGNCYSLKSMERAAEEAYRNFRRSFGTHTDDVLLTMKIGKNNYDGGNALRVRYVSRGGVDEDRLGTVSRNEKASFREDLSGSAIERITLNLRSNDDTCVRYFIFTAGREVSGTGYRKNLIIPAYVVADIMKIRLNSDCIWFGNDRSSIGDLTFRWKEALQCFDKHYRRSAHDYAVCLAQRSVVHFDVNTGSGWRRTSTSLW